ncbi:calcineurin-like phosphoesterase family protein [Sinorhizobium kostiense]|uniref:Calcineurin-like phosphoesterase family protein n=1 Tax=Sinorhizobium kostiense TaxID=76747 RepID=A0ABS4R059_9HYPH|nr:metallophosphoesterase [Sinorhizobium kostiense]MBP2235232.1 calcineurin-like phosphoesterase family protein [Sinorhizobium kostiense]
MAFTRKFYIADTHFCHERILGMQPRPFSTISEHDEAIIERWNSVVGDEDIIYHLGDVAFQLNKHADRIREIFSRLKGRKYLIIGNHDVTAKGDLHPVLAELDWATRPEHAMRTRDGGRDVYMSHYAARTWPCQHYGSVHFYGHSHGRLPGVGLSRDVGVDLPDVGFTPRSLDELTKGII